MDNVLCLQDAFCHKQYIENDNLAWSLYQFQSNTRYVCKTQMPPIMANSKYGQAHKDNYLDTST